MSITPQKPTHVTVIHRSTDGAKSWQKAATLDIGGRGNHDGLLEGALLPLDGEKVLGIFRTNLDFLYQSVSNDNGKTWSLPKPTKIQSSSSPAAIHRLKSGRIVLVYNPLYANGRSSIRRSQPGDSSTQSASWYRRELWLRWSDDQAQTWSQPYQLLPSQPQNVGYPQIVEPEPGKIWVTTYDGKVTIEFRESDLK